MSNSIFKKFEAKIDKKDRRLDISCEINEEELQRMHENIVKDYISKISLFDWIKGSRK